MRNRVAASLLTLACAAALLIFEPAIAMRFGPELSALRAAVANLTGAVRVRDVDTGSPSLQSDRLVIGLNGVQTPPSGFSLQAYLADQENGF